MPATAPLSLAKAADALYRALRNDDRLASLFPQVDTATTAKHTTTKLVPLLRQFLFEAFGEEEQWPSAIDTEAVEAASKDLIEVVLEAIERPSPPDEDALCFAMQLVGTEFAEDRRVLVFFVAVGAAFLEEEGDEGAEEGDLGDDEIAAVKPFDYIAYTHSASLVARAGPLQLPMVPPARVGISSPRSPHATNPLTTSHAELRCGGCNDLLVVVAPRCASGRFNTRCECVNMEHDIDITDWSVDGYVKIWHKQYLYFGPISKRQRTV
jgi:hypothetical protein